MRRRRHRMGALPGVLAGLIGIAATLPAIPVVPAHAGPVFVTRNGTGFDLGGQPFRFGGTNNYYLHYKSQLMVDDVFNDAAAMNLEVIRTWASLECGGDKPNSAGGCSQGTDLWMQRWSNAADGPVYNTGPNGLQKLDYMLAKANQLGMKLILPLVNNWQDFGGMDQYVTWYGLQYHDQFYTDARIRQDYKDWAATLVNRTNTITGVQYKNDPAIFSWELANEPRCINASLPTSGTCTQQTLTGWANEMSTYINSIDANHMISIGDEGFLDWNRPSDWPYNGADGVDHEALTSLPNIDYGTYHVYPDSWGKNVAWVTQWIVDHQTAADTYGKPVILEEFGLRDQSQRNAAYQTWVDTVRTGGGDGWNVWILTGIQDDGQLYPDYDGFRITYPSTTATLLANAAVAIGGGTGDTTPPTAPGTPSASDVTATTARLTWTASTDSGGSGLAGYDVYREQGANDQLLDRPTGTSTTLTGLSPNTAYQVYVRARDGAGNLSTPSPPVSFTTLPGGGTCRVGYQATDWGGSNGFTANVTITNTGTSTLSGWTLAFAFASGQRVTPPGWSATWTQPAGSASVTATPLDWNRNIAPNTSVGIGFNGTHTGTNPAPTAFTINGNPCESQQTVQGAPEQPHTWRNVQISGGGFVPGIVFNPTERNLIYARTDIGGAYRWSESTQRWTPLLDWVGWNNWGYNGVHSIATDPVQTNRVYAAVGMYTNSWDPNNGAILRSTNRGDSWQVSTLPFKLGGNMPGRGMGERLAVDPNRNSIVYFGAPNGNGLWRSSDFGATWAKVGSFPNAGNYAEDPNDPNGYLSHRPGVVWVSFDKSTAPAGTTTQGIYVGVADKNNTVYRSLNGGRTWERIAGQPTGFLAHKGVLDPVNHLLYIATSDTGGPYNGAKGDVWKFHTTTGSWTRISPIPSSSADDYFGYAGLTIDRKNPTTIMVATQISWWPDVIFFRSTDAGATWTRIWDWAAYPNRTFRYTMDISSSPWLTFGSNPQLPEVTPKLGWMTESLEIDPFNSNRMMYGTGATIYGTTNLANWDSGTQITIRPMAAGLEETAVLDLISPPSGAPLISGLGDIGGFRHTNLDTVPPLMFTRPGFTSTTSLDYAERTPGVMVRAGNFTDADRPNDSHVAFSTDGGANWFQGTEPGGVDEGGTVAAAADGSRFVWAPRGQPAVFSVGFGNSWTQAQGLPVDAVVESDRVNPSKFYGFSGGRLYVSTNGGANFAATAPAGLPSTAKFKAVAGREGDIWLAGDTGLFHSTDSGASFARHSTVTSARNIGFGRAATGQTYPALYTVATIDGITGVYRSDNAGASWVRINDDRHQYGNMGEAITGDPRIYGRVYLGTNGRGILYANPR